MAVVISEHLSKEIQGKMLGVIAAIQPYYPEEIEQAYLSQTKGATEGERRYRALWIFTKNYMGEIQNPMAHPERLAFDIAPLLGRIDWLRLKAQNYELAAAGDESVLELEFSTSDGLSGTLSAIGRDCDVLMQIFESQFKANLGELNR